MKMKKILLTAVAALLLVAVSVGGTIAYLTATSSTVVNTFTPHNIGESKTLEIWETTTGRAHADDTDEAAAEHTSARSFDIIPGYTYGKDPHVNLNTSVDAYVFIEVTESKKYDTSIVPYAVDEDVWTALDKDNNPGVYYKVVEAGTYSCDNEDGDNALYILAGNQVAISDKLTNSEIGADAMTLTFQAWAIQKMKDNSTAFTAAEAWELLNAE